MIAAAIFAASIANGQPNDRQHQDQAAPANQAQNYSKRPLPITVIGPVGLEREKTVEPDWTKPNCEKPSNHDEADLCQQMSMAVAAQKTVALNYVQIAIGAFTIIGLAFTVYYTRETAKAAVDATDIAKRALHDLERPFVFVKELDWFYEENPQTGVFYQGRLSVVLENSGSTPATRMTYSVNCGHIAASDIETYNFDDQTRNSVSKGVLGPKATLTTASQRISAATVTQLMPNVDRWFIWGAIEYDDVFEGTARHRTEYCFEIRAREMANKNLFFWFPMHNRFNATDGDCLRQPQPYQAA